jgi:hypothetical protein
MCPPDYGIDFEDDLILDNEELAFDEEFLADHENRYINPKPAKGVPDHLLKFEHAMKLAGAINLDRGQRAHCLISGNFIMGDFIEALFYKKNIHAKRLSISTLSLNANNVDSVRNLMDGGYVDTVDLIVSDYFSATSAETSSRICSRSWTRITGFSFRSRDRTQKLLHLRVTEAGRS